MLLRRARAASTLAARMSQELRALSGSQGAPSLGAQLVDSRPATPPPPPPPPKVSTKRKEFVRRMPQHVLPPYVEANFRLMTFVFTRAPKLDDFPHERFYRKESIDLLFRHYYKNRRA